MGKANRSAKGAQYESQGQARSKAERVAPGFIIKIPCSPEKGVITAPLFRPFRPQFSWFG